MAANTIRQQSARSDNIDRPRSLSRSASTTSSKVPAKSKQPRPKSRGSTSSLQSVEAGVSFQPIQPSQPSQNAPVEESGYFPGDASQQSAHTYPQPNMDEHAMMVYQQNMQMRQHPQAHMVQHDMRPMSGHAYANMQQMPMGYPEAMAYGMPAQHMHHIRHPSEQYEGSPAPEDSNNENGGSKRRKGTASSLANDQELRRLLAQYQQKTLREIATEVQKNEGSGGKSEKAKQVFAMLWLQETCQRSNNSVRRDKVFARYTERCGNERVPTLNPASFGKLVRIIFPNVQTRRLGVRGESKYHYVDLSLVPDENDSGFDLIERPTTVSGTAIERPTSAASLTRPLPLNTKPTTLNLLPPRMSMETADFPAPSAPNSQSVARERKRNADPTAYKQDCRHLNTPPIKISRIGLAANIVNALPMCRPNMPGTMSTYLSMPSKSTLSQPVPTSQENPIELPDIHEHLRGETYDHHIAKLLHDLYRSYCIDVIDAFRKCKDKSFFNHHSAFNGKMTVPVAKLFNLECLAAWIQECDMRMYKQILRYMTPLVLQEVPDLVWASFDRVSQRLVGFLITSFEEKCPPHVVAAKAVPAARFTNILKKLRSAQTASVQLNRMLENPQTRQQMWLDLCSVLDPDHTAQESNAPLECSHSILAILKHDLRALLCPDPDPLVDAAEQDPTSLFARFYQDRISAPPTGHLPADAANLDIVWRLTAWLECLPDIFDGHHPQCMLDWQTRFFRSMMTQFGAGGAISYQSWWYFENFTHQVLSFMTELEGLLLSQEAQNILDSREKDKCTEILRDWKHTSPVDDRKRKRPVMEVADEERPKSPKLSRPNTAGGDTETEAETRPVSTASKTFPTSGHNSIINPPLLTPTTELPPPPPPPAGEDEDDDMAAIANGGPLDLPSFKTGFTSPAKGANDTPRRIGAMHDDSGIGMGLEDHDADALEAEKEAKKFNKRDWFLSSDPVEPGHALHMVS